MKDQTGPEDGFGKFEHPAITAKGEPRATVALTDPQTLWFNTGTLCNIACENCYIESSPSNDRLVYLTADEVSDFLDQLDARNWGVRLHRRRAVHESRDDRNDPAGTGPGL